MNVGRSVAAGVSGFFLFLFLGLDLVLFGVIALDSILVTVLPVVGLVLGAVAGALVPKVGEVDGAAFEGAAAGFAPPAPTAVPVAPPMPAAPTAGFVPTHTVPLAGLPAFAGPDATVAPVGRLDPALPVRVVVWQGEWAEVVCENGWEAWVNAALLVPAG